MLTKAEFEVRNGQSTAKIADKIITVIANNLERGKRSTDIKNSAFEDKRSDVIILVNRAVREKGWNMQVVNDARAEGGNQHDMVTVHYTILTLV